MPITDEIKSIAPQAVVKPIDKEQVAEATKILQKYKQGKAQLEQKIVANQQWYRVRQWQQMQSSDTTQVEPSSAWLFNCLANKHADAMDNFPAPNVLPREESDRQEAKMLSDIIPVILDQDDFEETYDEAIWYKLITGTVCYGVFWDASKNNGLGDVSVKVIDLLNLFWEPGIVDLQASRNIFNVELQDNDELEAQYPQLKGKLSTPSINVTQYQYDDTIDTSNKSIVVDWYYKKNVNGKRVLHYVKYVNDEVLFSTENNNSKGLYDDGEYPFVFDVLFPIQGQLAGFGYIDIGKSPQEYIDRIGQCVLKNALANAAPRFFVREDGKVNESEFLDYKKPIVHYAGQIDSSIIPIQGKSLEGSYLNVQQMKIDELKEVTGTRDVSTGGGVSGVTAASAIAALQEAGSKLSRDDNKSTYRAYKRIIVMIIERIRQFYNTQRSFRILGEQGAMEFVTYTNKGIAMQDQGSAFGVSLGHRLPLFDVEISAEKKSPYSRMSQNELALQFYNQGFFNPQMSDQASAALDMMDFDRKSFIQERIAQNGGIFQQLQAMQQQALALAQIVDEVKGSNIAEQLMAQITNQPAPPFVEGNGSVEMPQESAGNIGEAKNTRDARQRVADSTSPQ